MAGQAPFSRSKLILYELQELAKESVVLTNLGRREPEYRQGQSWVISNSSSLTPRWDLSRGTASILGISSPL